MSSFRRRLLRAHAAAPTVVVLLSLVVLVAAWIRFTGFADSSTNCPQPASDLWVTGAFAGVVGAFLLGGLLGKVPHKDPGPNPRAGLGAQLGLTVFITLITIAWGYETFALANPNPPSWANPITHYILCIKVQENDWTLLVFIVGALIAGRWLWHQPGTHFQ